MKQEAVDLREGWRQGKRLSLSLSLTIFCFCTVAAKVVRRRGATCLPYLTSMLLNYHNKYQNIKKVD
jgi:hypothetical protein